MKKYLFFLLLVLSSTINLVYGQQEKEAQSPRDTVVIIKKDTVFLVQKKETVKERRLRLRNERRVLRGKPPIDSLEPEVQYVTGKKGITIGYYLNLYKLTSLEFPSISPQVNLTFNQRFVIGLSAGYVTNIVPTATTANSTTPITDLIKGYTWEIEGRYNAFSGGKTAYYIAGVWGNAMAVAKVPRFLNTGTGYLRYGKQEVVGRKAIASLGIGFDTRFGGKKYDFSIDFQGGMRLLNKFSYVEQGQFNRHQVLIPVGTPELFTIDRNIFFNGYSGPDIYLKMLIGISKW